MSNRALEQAVRGEGMLHQVWRKVVLEDLQIPRQNRDEWLKLLLSVDGIMGEAFVTNLKSRAKWLRISEPQQKSSGRWVGQDKKPSK